MRLALVVKEHKVAKTNQDIVTCHVVAIQVKEPRGKIPMVELVVFPGNSSWSQHQTGWRWARHGEPFPRSPKAWDSRYYFFG